MKSSKAGWIIALVMILIAVIQQIQIQNLKRNEGVLGKEVFRLQALSSSAVRSFRQPLSAQQDSWVAPLMRPISKYVIPATNYKYSMSSELITNGFAVGGAK